ncbi:MAG: helix-turn-helix domain-containing protein [Candidatus Dojkabacteria bacterium]|nr:helix-turn-helix domain-containing protein [Candidatus Dojkabacteria bacterium]
MEENKIGKFFRVRRKEKGISIEKASKDTLIKEEILKYIENDEFSKIHGHAYVKGFLKIYSEYLDLDPEKIIYLYKKNYELVDVNKNFYTLSNTKKEKNKKIETKISLKKYFRKILILLVINLIFVFTFIITISYITRPPILEIRYPINFKLSNKTEEFVEIKYNEPIFKIYGQTEKDVVIKINDSQINVNPISGEFVIDAIPILDKENILKITAENKLGISTTLYLKILRIENDEKIQKVYVKAQAGIFLFLSVDEIIKVNSILDKTFEQNIAFYREIVIRTNDYTKIKLLDENFNEIQINSNEYRIINKKNAS